MPFLTFSVSFASTVHPVLAFLQTCPTQDTCLDWPSSEVLSTTQRVVSAWTGALHKVASHWGPHAHQVASNSHGWTSQTTKARASPTHPQVHSNHSNATTEGHAQLLHTGGYTSGAPGSGNGGLFF